MEDARGLESARSSKPKLMLMAVVVVVVLLISAGFGAWHFFLRHLSIEDLAPAVINDPTPAAPGFKHSLAGKSIAVDGKVTNITSKSTTIGTLSMVELDGFAYIPLIEWGVPAYAIG